MKHTAEDGTVLQNTPECSKCSQDDIPEMLISILLPVYNVALYVEECLSLLSDGMHFLSDARKIEVVAVDDASTDLSYKILCEGLNRLRCPTQIVKHSENMGVSQSRNTLLKLARGRYIWFVDPDDKPVPAAIQLIMQSITADSPDVIMFDWFTQNELRKDKRNKPLIRRRSAAVGAFGLIINNPQEATARVLLKDKLYLWNKVFKRSLAQNIVFPEQRYFEDIAFSAAILLKSRRTRYLSNALITYRHREGSIVNAPTLAKMDDWLQGLRDLSAVVNSNAQIKKSLAVAITYSQFNNYLDIIERYNNAQQYTMAQQVFNEMLAAVRMSFRQLLFNLLVSIHWLPAVLVCKKMLRVKRCYAISARFNFF